MDIVVGGYYTGPGAKRYRVIGIEEGAGDRRRLAIQAAGSGVIRLPLEDAAQWLRPIGTGTGTGGGTPDQPGA